MKTLEISKATESLAVYAKRANHEPIIITQKGKPVAALVPIENSDLETVTVSTDRKFLALIERSRARQKAEGGIASKELRRRASGRGAKR